MPEARDRLPRPIDIAAVFARRRAGVLGILDDTVTTGSGLFGTLRTLRITPSSPTRLVATRAGALGRGSFENLHNQNGNRTLPVGRENTPVTIARRRRGRGADSVLPSWYPRRPLGDITVVVRAIERRRARLRDEESPQIGLIVSYDEAFTDTLLSASVAQLEHETPMKTPGSMVKAKHYTSVGKVPKILLGVTNQSTGEEDCLTPQKKLLNSIDTVEKAVLEELQKLKKTPTAKKAERQKRDFEHRKSPLVLHSNF